MSSKMKETPSGSGKKRRYKVKCESCGNEFNNDFKRKHEEACHGGQAVKVSNIGAPLNPFEAAKKRKTKTDAPNDVVDQQQQPTTNFIFSSDPAPVPQSVEHISDSTSVSAVIAIGESAGDPRESNTSWLECAGKFKLIIDTVKDDGKELLEKIQLEVIPNQLTILLEMVDTVQNIKNACEVALSACTAAIVNITHASSANTVDEDQPECALVNHDPGLRHTIEFDNQRSYLISLGPHQPKLCRFPAEVGNRKNRFNPAWYKEYQHIEYSTFKDAAYCFVCSLFPKGPHREKAETAWSTDGVRTWGKMKSAGLGKRGKLEKHFSSDAHKAALQDYCSFLMRKGHVDVLLDRQKRAQIIEEERQLAFNTDVIKILVDIARTLARQGLAYRGSGSEEGSNYLQMVRLVSRHNPVLRRWLNDIKMRPFHTSYLSPRAQNEFIELLASVARDKIIAEILASEFFSVMADTTPDVSHKDILSIVVRCVDANGLPNERLLQIEEAKDKTGAGLAKNIVDCLERNTLDVGNLAFQSYDFAASMSGEFNGAQQKVSELVGHKVPYAPCQAHRTNTAVEHSCKESLVIADMFSILEELYAFFSASTKRFQPLKEKLNKVENSLQLRNLSKTRWTARAESIKAVETALETICEMLVEMMTSKEFDSKTRGKALGLHKRVLSFDFIISLMFMKNFMYKMKSLTESLESVELNVIDAIALIENTSKSLEMTNRDTDGMNNLIKSAISFSSKLGIDAEQDFNRHHRRRLAPQRMDENRDSEASFTLNSFFRKEFKAVLDTLTALLGSNMKDCMQNLNPLFEIFSIPVSKSVLTVEKLKQALDLFPSKDDRPDVYALQAEIEMLFNNCSQAKSMSEVMNKACEMKGILKLAFRFVKLVITAGFSVATNERKFSQLKFVKTVLRSTMTDERLDHLMLLSSEKDITDGLDLSLIVTSWARLKQRRIRVKEN